MSDFAYIISKVRAKIGRLLSLEDYKAILGSNKPFHVINILSKAGYPKSQLLKLNEKSFLELTEPINEFLNKEFDSIILESPIFLKNFLDAYRGLLESQSIVSTLKLAIRLGGLISKANIIPLNTINKSFYEYIVLKDSLNEAINSLKDKNLQELIVNRLKEALIYGCTSPLYSLIGKFIKDCLKILKGFKKPEKNSYRLLGLFSDLANIQIIFNSKLKGLNFLISKQYLINEINYRIKKESLLEFLTMKDSKAFFESLSKTWFKRYMNKVYELSLKIDSIYDALDTPCLKALADESRIVLTGYPFQLSTILSALNLKWIEVRNINLTLLSLENRINPLIILKLLIIP